MAITRAPPPTGRPPMYAVAGRAFGRANLRPVVIVMTIFAIVWSVIWTAGAFEDISSEKQNNDTTKLVTYDIVLGSMYAGVAAIEFFGLFAAISRRTSLARLFVGMSLAVVVISGSAELVRTVAHFVFKGPIVAECVAQSTSRADRTTFGFWTPSAEEFREDDAQDYCNSAYNRMSFSTIAWLILVLILSTFFASTAYSFYRQLLDPNTFRAPRAPSDQVRLEALRPQPYGSGYLFPPRNNAPTYAPPPGPPPGAGGYAPPYEGGRLPEYGSEFAAKSMGDEKEGEKKGEDPFLDAQHTGLGVGPSEAELGSGYRV
ncbi:hypothetical protein K439DRAFT_1631240 [Ramaria rubella]|nr:hypothetical protein K439DRAFT_1631240 [Ramaria rubella]